MRKDCGVGGGGGEGMERGSITSRQTETECTNFL